MHRYAFDDMLFPSLLSATPRLDRWGRSLSHLTQSLEDLRATGVERMIRPESPNLRVPPPSLSDLHRYREPDRAKDVLGSIGSGHRSAAYRRLDLCRHSADLGFLMQQAIDVLIH